MHLERLDVQGFKTFAQKTSVSFLPPKSDRQQLTVIVGPNGSGKSNLADAIRWCLGEQSMKHLRGKKAEDIIFSGSEGKSRSGYAEVSMTFNNEKKRANVPWSEITVTRRLYRDGETEYLLNGEPARLSDIQLLLAESGVGQRSYAVIGQGMIDHVLTASPEERKIFFDDATGVRGLQMRRHQSVLKLERSLRTLEEAEALLREIEPRLNLLRRQVKRLNEREQIEEELKRVSLGYYSTLFWNLQKEKDAVLARVSTSDLRVAQRRHDLKIADEKFAALATSHVPVQTDDGAAKSAQLAYKEANAKREAARQALFSAEREIEITKAKARASWAPLPLDHIVTQMKDIVALHESAYQALQTARTSGDWDALERVITSAHNKAKSLRDRLVEPKIEEVKIEDHLTQAVADAKKRLAEAEDAVHIAEEAADAAVDRATADKTELIALQKELRRLQTELSTEENARNAQAVELARAETRLEALSSEMSEQLGPLGEGEVRRAPPENPISDLATEQARLGKLRHQLALIGAIDPEVAKEHGEVESRFTFLAEQSDDLRGAISSTEKIVDELDGQIAEQSTKKFKTIKDEFQKYFAVLFGGGNCSLIQVTREALSQDVKVAADRAMEEVAGEAVQELQTDSARARLRLAEKTDAIMGVDIEASPPGKKVKNLSALSGGERALTSIALLSAIMATNPSPFVVLDEVDAALDETNTVRFANILRELCTHTQFIVISHNRATMEKADALYGVTMGDDGISRLLSVKLEDIAGEGSARR
ncbi:AAA family ATPase [Patescibacteria group bacterium]|nr:AAA family ATPase [Patescibacteria group bacterium]